jgi:hypothetical protein
MKDDSDSYNIKCTFGRNKMVLLHRTIVVGEEEETVKGCDDVVPVGDTENVMEPPESEQFEPDLDDLADTEEVIYTDTASTKHEAWAAH